MPNTFGDNLKKTRTAKEISQQDLAELIDIHYTHISRYERNLATPSIEVVKKMAEAMQVSIDSLIYGSSENKAKNNIQDNDLLNLFTQVQQLDKNDITTIKSLIKAYVFQKDTQQRLAQ